MRFVIYLLIPFVVIFNTEAKPFTLKELEGCGQILSHEQPRCFRDGGTFYITVYFEKDPYRPLFTKFEVNKPFSINPTKQLIVNSPFHSSDKQHHIVIPKNSKFFKHYLIFAKHLYKTYSKQSDTKAQWFKWFIEHAEG